MLGDKAYYIEGLIWRVYSIQPDVAFYPVFALLSFNYMGLQTIDRYVTGLAPFVCETLKNEAIDELMNMISVKLSKDIIKKHICSHITKIMTLRHLQDSLAFKLSKLVIF